MKIYTRTGDDGTTGLLGGSRVKKYNLRLKAYGTIDELNAYIGVIRSLQEDKGADLVLEKIQNKLFAIGAQLASDDAASQMVAQFQCTTGDIQFLESEMDRMVDQLPPLNNFILPAGTQATSFCHVARTVCRRAERHIVELADHTDVSSNLLIYINRLSDYFFVLSRKITMDLNAEEILWSPEN